MQGSLEIMCLKRGIKHKGGKKEVNRGAFSCTNVQGVSSHVRLNKPKVGMVCSMIPSLM